MRLLQSDLLVEDVQRGSAGHSYLKMVWEDADPLDQLLDQNTAFLVLRSRPHGFDIEIPEDGSDLLETDLQIAPRALLLLFY
jgi:hypothetical protein